MLRKTACLALMLCLAEVCCAQALHTVNIVPVVRSERLKAGAPYVLGSADTVIFNTLRFYVAPVSPRGIVRSHVRLVELTDSASMNVSVPGNATAIAIGLDSATSCSGALSGALDPARGMYWAWQSGYINIRIEGSCTAFPQREFSLHLGGYRAPFLALTTIKLSDADSLSIDLDAFLTQFIAAKLPPKIMSPGKAACDASQLFARSISEWHP